MYCTCGKTQGYACLDADLWVCSNCKRPSRLVFRKLTNMRAPYGAIAVLSVKGMRDGRSIIRWDMSDGKKETLEFHSYPRKVNMDAGESLLLRTWQLLDSKVEVIMADDPDPWPSPEKQQAKNRAKYEARGIAETLAILMQPFLTEADDVVRHAVKRYKAKQAGEDYEVPGLSEHIWDPTKNWDGSDRIQFKSKGTKTSPAKKKLGKQLSSEERQSVKTALAAGMFTPQQLADTFKVSLQQIEECR